MTTCCTKQRHQYIVYRDRERESGREKTMNYLVKQKRKKKDIIVNKKCIILQLYVLTYATIVCSTHATSIWKHQLARN